MNVIKTGFEKIDGLLPEGLPSKGLVLFGTTFDSVPLSIRMAVNLAEDNDLSIGYLASKLTVESIECLIKSTQVNPAVVKQIDNGLRNFGDFEVDQNVSLKDWRRKLELVSSNDDAHSLDEILWYVVGKESDVVIVDWSYRNLSQDWEEVKRDVSTLRAWAETENRLVILFAPLDIQFNQFPSRSIMEFADIFISCKTLDNGISTVMTVEKCRVNPMNNLGKTVKQLLGGIKSVVQTATLLKFLFDI